MIGENVSYDLTGPHVWARIGLSVWDEVDRKDWETARWRLIFENQIKNRILSPTQEKIRRTG